MRDNVRRFVVVGGDSMLGRALIDYMSDRCHEIVGTTRRSKNDKSKLFLDLLDPKSWSNISDHTDVCIVAGITDYEDCRVDPLAKEINVIRIPELVNYLTSNNMRVTFISSNTVFGGLLPWPKERDTHKPGLEYGRQKSQAEKRIADLCGKNGTSNLVKVVRLTKILTLNTRPLPDWFENWACGSKISAFSDLMFSPITLMYATRSLCMMFSDVRPGYFHISGSRNVDYVSFAKLLASELGFSQSLVGSTTSKEAGIIVPYLPMYSGLNMDRTISRFDLTSQSLDEVLQELTKDVHVND